MSLLWREREAQLDREFSARFDSWKNRNDRFREEHSQPERNAFDGVIYGGILSLLVWVPLLVYFWRTK